MSQWVEQYKNHQVWQLLQSLGPVIDNAFGREDIEPSAIEGLSRLKSVLTFVGRRLAGADPYLFQPSSLDSVGGDIQSATQEIQSFIANGSTGHIANANSYGDNALTHLSQINVQITTEDFLAAKEAAEAYRTGVEIALSGITEEATQISAEISSLRTQTADLSAELTAERTRFSSIVSDFQTQFSSAQESRVNLFAIDQGKRQDLFSELFNTFTQKLNEQNIEFNKQREDISRLHQGEIAALKDEFVDKANNLHEEILEHKTAVEKLVGVIGNLGVTSGYLRAANVAKLTVRVWQTITVIAMVALIIIAYMVFLPTIVSGFTWAGFAGRVFVTLTIGALAAYAGTQADKYQKVERNNRRLALELEAIGPFIAPLSEDKQADFRIMIGDRSFGQGEGTHIGLDAKSPTSIIEAFIDHPKIKDIITRISKLAKL